MPSKNERLAIELASASDAFEDDADPDPETVIRATLKAQLDTLKSREEAAEKRQAELKADILGEDYTEADATSGDTEEELSDVEREQQRLREDILGHE